ncbi:MAG: SAM-dependent methyltransferase [Saprospiraceae bacterium]|nr:SAM-dependent methyltransferase [Saprospiraceae bacterium]
MSSKACLYLIPVPLSGAGIGQMSTEAIATAHRLNFFISERPKTSRKWIKDIGHPLPQSQITVIDIADISDNVVFNNMVQLLGADTDMGLLSEAGMPCIADPGYELVAQLSQLGHKVKPLSGPNSMMMALMASGMPGQNFTFHGYLSAKKEELREELIKISKAAKSTGFTQIFMETPYRNKQVFSTLLSVSPQEMKLCVAASIGAPNEAILTSKIKEWRKLDLNSFIDHPAIFLLGA